MLGSLPPWLLAVSTIFLLIGSRVDKIYFLAQNYSQAKVIFDTAKRFIPRLHHS